MPSFAQTVKPDTNLPPISLIAANNDINHASPKNPIAAEQGQKQLGRILEFKKAMNNSGNSSVTPSAPKPSTSVSVPWSVVGGLAFTAGVGLMAPTFLPFAKIASAAHTGHTMQQSLKAENDPVYVQNAPRSSSFADSLAPDPKMMGRLNQMEEALMAQVAHHNKITLRIKSDYGENLGFIPAAPVLKAA